MLILNLVAATYQVFGVWYTKLLRIMLITLQSKVRLGFLRIGKI